MDRWVGLQEF